MTVHRFPTPGRVADAFRVVSIHDAYANKLSKMAAIDLLLEYQAVLCDLNAEKTGANIDREQCCRRELARRLLSSQPVA